MELKNARAVDGAKSEDGIHRAVAAEGRLPVGRRPHERVGLLRSSRSDQKLLDKNSLTPLSQSGTTGTAGRASSLNERRAEVGAEQTEAASRGFVESWEAVLEAPDNVYRPDEARSKYCSPG